MQRPSPRVRRRTRRARPLLAAVVPVIGAAGVVAAVVLGGGIVITPAAGAPDARPAAAGIPTAARVPVWFGGPVAPGPLAGVAPDAAAATDAVRERRAERRAADLERQRARSAGAAAGVCDLTGPPRFDDPARPNEITNRDCGYVDGQGRERSRDPWIDDQLRSSYGE